VGRPERARAPLAPATVPPAAPARPNTGALARLPSLSFFTSLPARPLASVTSPPTALGTHSAYLEQNEAWWAGPPTVHKVDRGLGYFAYEYTRRPEAAE